LDKLIASSLKAETLPLDAVEMVIHKNAAGLFAWTLSTARASGQNLLARIVE
jgi:hypothetical protein